MENKIRMQIFIKIFITYFFLVPPSGIFQKIFALQPTNCIDILNKKIASMAPITEDISFLIADLKFDGKDVKICEFGEVTRSRFKGYDHMVGKGTIWQNFWRILDEHNFSKWYIDKHLISRFAETQKEIAFNYLLINNGNVAESAESIDRLIKKTQSKKQQSGKKIFVFRHQDASNNQVEYFRKSHHDGIVLNAATAPFVNGKYTTEVLFQDKNLRHFRPEGLLCRKLYTPQLAASIKQLLPAENYVIKPLNAFKGCGVIMVEKDDLDATLKKILKPDKNLLDADFTVNYNGYSYTDHTLSHWAIHRQPYFIIEKMCSSKIIEIDGKRYDPTMRVVFVLRYLNKTIKVDYIASYWKLPLKDLDDNEGSCTEKHKSVGIIPILTTDEEKRITYASLDKLLPALYAKMIKIINKKTPLKPSLI